MLRRPIPTRTEPWPMSVGFPRPWPGQCQVHDPQCYRRVAFDPPSVGESHGSYRYLRSARQGMPLRALIPVPRFSRSRSIAAISTSRFRVISPRQYRQTGPWCGVAKRRQLACLAKNGVGLVAARSVIAVGGKPFLGQFPTGGPRIRVTQFAIRGSPRPGHKFGESGATSGESDRRVTQIETESDDAGDVFERAGLSTALNESNI